MRTVNATRYKVGVIQTDTRPVDNRFWNMEWSTNRTRDWAASHGYSYVLQRKESNKYPPYWLKVKLLQDALKLYDEVIWFDTDAVPACLEYSLNDLKPLWGPSRCMLLSPDPPVWHSPFMAGVFVIKRTVKSTELVDFWLSLYNASHWNLTRTKGELLWSTYMPWGGMSEAYEQGAFVRHILKNESYAPFLGVVDWPVFHEHQFPPPHPELTFAYHFSGGFKRAGLASFAKMPVKETPPCKLDLSSAIVWDSVTRPESTPYSTFSSTPTASG